MQSKFLIQNIIGYEVFETQTAAQQIIGREGETATLFWRCPLPFTLTLAVSAHVTSAVRCFRVLT
jgi:hypothetical protein